MKEFQSLTGLAFIIAVLFYAMGFRTFISIASGVVTCIILLWCVLRFLYPDNDLDDKIDLKH